MRRDRALAKELGAILDGLHDPTVSDDPFVWLATEAEQQRRHDDLRTVRERLASFVYVSRAGTIAKLLGFGTLLPLILFGLLFAADLPRNPALRAGPGASSRSPLASSSLSPSASGGDPGSTATSATPPTRSPVGGPSPSATATPHGNS